MNLTTSRFTISTMLVAACATVALVAAESAEAHSAVPLQRIEIVGQRFVATQRIVIVGQRQTEPAVQRIVIVGQRQRNERLAATDRHAHTL